MSHLCGRFLGNKKLENAAIVFKNEKTNRLVMMLYDFEKGFSVCEEDSYEIQYLARLKHLHPNLLKGEIYFGFLEQ